MKEIEERKEDELRTEKAMAQEEETMQIVLLLSCLDYLFLFAFNQKISNFRPINYSNFRSIIRF